MKKEEEVEVTRRQERWRSSCAGDEGGDEARPWPAGDLRQWLDRPGGGQDATSRHHDGCLQVGHVLDVHAYPGPSSRGEKEDPVLAR